MERQALGALVITASHNPPEWLGLKIKGPFGGSVEGDFTAAVEQRLAAEGVTPPIKGTQNALMPAWSTSTDSGPSSTSTVYGADSRPWDCTVIVDPMHGSAAGCMAELLGGPTGLVREIRSDRDPLFGGNPPEP